MLKNFFIIFLLAVALLLTACGRRQTNLMLNEKTAPKSMDDFNDQEIKQRIMELKNGLKPKINSQNKPSPALGPPKIIK